MLSADVGKIPLGWVNEYSWGEKSVTKWGKLRVEQKIGKDFKKCLRSLISGYELYVLICFMVSFGKPPKAKGAVAIEGDFLYKVKQSLLGRNLFLPSFYQYRPESLFFTNMFHQFYLFANKKSILLSVNIWQLFTNLIVEPLFLKILQLILEISRF